MKTLKNCSNVAVYREFYETNQSGYMIREFFHNSLYDRISSRPHLTIVEKKWIVFQMMMAIKQIHSVGVCHGDIKCENIMVTSSNWCYLTDFALFKPTFIPENNSADYSFFFDTSGDRKTCYIAPERILISNTPNVDEGQLHTTMDIFSAGCVIAELFLEGTKLFSWGQLVSYRKGEYDPEPEIAKIPDSGVQSLVRHMIQKEPTKRLSAEGYLNQWIDVFPTYFFHLHPFLSSLFELETDKKIMAIHREYPELVQRFAGINNPTPVLPQPDISEELHAQEEKIRAQKRKKISLKCLEQDRNTLDEKFSRECREMNRDPTFQLLVKTEQTIDHLETDKQRIHLLRSKMQDLGIFNTNQSMSDRTSIKSSSMNEEDQKQPIELDGFVIILDVICAFAQTIRLPSTMLITLDLFSMFSQYVDSEIRLQRIVPYLVAFLSSPSTLVCATTIRVLTSVLEQVMVFNVGDAHIFPAYIIPALSRFNDDSTPRIINEAYSECLPRLAVTARRFLEASQFITQNSEVNQQDEEDLILGENFDLKLKEIQLSFDSVVNEMLLKQDSSTVCNLWDGSRRLCMFLGKQMTNKHLTIMSTYPDNRDNWELRSAFFRGIIGLSSFIGMDSVEDLLLPFIINSLGDGEDLVVEEVLNCLASLCEIKLFRKNALFDIVMNTAPMLHHHNDWIRKGVIKVMSLVANQLPIADVHCQLRPLLRPYLITSISEVNESNLTESLLPPVDKKSFHAAIELAREIVNQNPYIKNELRDSPSSFYGNEAEEDQFDGTFSSHLPQLRLSTEEYNTISRMRIFIKSIVKINPNSGKIERTKKAENSAAYLHFSKATNGLTLHSNIPHPLDEIIGSPKKLTKSNSNLKSEDVKKISNSPKKLASSSSSHNLGSYPSSPLKLSSNHIKHNVSQIPSALTQSFFPFHQSENESGIDLSPIGAAVLGKTSCKDWVPKGIMVAHLHEHKGPVNQVQIANDCTFFASASDDGTVKIWDCPRLEQHATNRSRLTYSSQGGKIKSLAILENTHSIAAGSTDGSIHILRVDHSLVWKKDHNQNLYHKIDAVKKINICDPLIDVQHFTVGKESLLMYATNQGKIHGWDLRMKGDAWVLDNSLRLGLLSCFTVEPGKNWFVTGTHSGYFTCWDMRFNLPVKSWGTPNRLKLHKLANCPNSPSSIFVTNGTTHEVTVWDVESGTCRQIFRTVAEGQNQRPIIKAVPPPSPNDYGVEELQNPSRSSMAGSSGVKAILSPDPSILITGGDDRKIKFWNMHNVQASFSLGYHSNPHSFSSNHYGGLQVYQEQEESLGIGNSLSGGATSKIRGPAFPSIHHKESILDLKILEHPQRMLLSSGRDGVIKAWK